MRNLGSSMAWMAIAVCQVLTGCGGQTTPAATAVPANYVLTVSSLSPASGVAVSVAPADINGASSGSSTFTRTYTAGTSVTLTAPATSTGNTFVSWTGCASVSALNCTVVLNANTTATANYAAPISYSLTVNSVNPGAGVAIGVAPSDLNAKTSGMTNFTLSYNSGTSVTLTAPSSSGSNAFAAWTGCTSSTGVTCTVVLSGNSSVTANYAIPVTYVLTVNSVSPSSGVTVTATPADNNSKGAGTTAFPLTYNTGTSVVLTAPGSYAGYSFVSWTGCTTAVGVTCDVTLNGNTTISVAYNQPSVQSVVVTPNQAVTIGATQQFGATVAGSGSYSSAVTWSLAGPVGNTLSPGTLSTTGLYTTPYPAPPSVTITATSVQDATKSGSVTVSLAPPAAGTGPALTVDAGNQTHAISPYIYGMNSYTLSPTVAKAANITIDRFGGDATSRYNYLLDVTSSAADYYYENQVGATGQQNTGQFNAQVISDAGVGAKTIGSVNILGWVAKDGTSCSFPLSSYPNQYAVDTYRNCGDGELLNQTNITGVSPGVTSIAVGPSFAGNWVAYLVSKFGTAANGGVAIYDLDNEPANWDSVHRDVHPLPSTYDEVTNNGIATAQAIKAADPTAQVSGPVIDNWWNYFYSKKDIEAGWAAGPCYQPWGNPVDRKAHGGIPFIEYYLQQFAAQQVANKPRLLDYVDVHTYFAANYLGSSVSFTTAGNTGEQQARLNSTRVFWDPTYTDPSYSQPNYSTDSNYTPGCSPAAQAPQVITMMQTWIKNDYPGTKTAITEYNFGGQEAINGALAQADILGIFGSYGLDLGALWGPPDPTKQIPGLKAFQIYRNYDGNNSTFGDQALSSTSANQGALSVYGALRTSDSAKTIVVINKSYGDLTATLSLAHVAASANETAKVYLYSNANLAGIVAQTAVTVSPPAAGSTTSTISTTFPAQSITLLVVP